MWLSNTGRVSDGRRLLGADDRTEGQLVVMRLIANRPKLSSQENEASSLAEVVKVLSLCT